MKKLLKAILIIIIFSFPLYGDPLNVNIPCDGNGTVLINGEFDQISGNISVTLNYNNCTLNDEEDTAILNGTINLNGILQGIGGNINLTITFNNFTFSEQSFDEDLSEKYNESCSGTITLQGNSTQNEVVNLQKRFSLNCSGNGNTTMNYNDFINSLIFMDFF